MRPIDQLLDVNKFDKFSTEPALQTVFYTRKGILSSTLLFAISNLENVERELVQRRIIDIFDWVTENVKRDSKLAQIGLNYVLTSEREIDREYYKSFIDMHAVRAWRKLIFSPRNITANTKDIIIQSICCINTQENQIEISKAWILLGSVRKVVKGLGKVDLASDI